jgi:hypothetical protein
MKDKIIVSVAIGEEMTPLEGYAVKIETPAGTFQIGVDNNGKTYLSSERDRLCLEGRAANRMIISGLKD